MHESRGRDKNYQFRINDVLVIQILVDNMNQFRDVYQLVDEIEKLNVIKINYYSWEVQQCLNLTFIYKDSIVGRVDIQVKKKIFNRQHGLELLKNLGRTNSVDQFEYEIQRRIIELFNKGEVYG